MKLDKATRALTKTIKFSGIMIIMVWSTQIIYAQIGPLRILSVKSLKDTMASVQQSHFNPISNKICWEYRNSILKNNSFFRYEQGIITEDNLNIRFDEGESFLSWNGNILNTVYRKAEMEDVGITKFYSFQISGNSRKLNKELKFDVIGLPFSSLNEGKNIVLNDYQSDFGVNFVFFDNLLKHKATYTPSKKGIDFYAVNSTKDKTVIVSKVSNDSLYNIAYFDSDCKMLRKNEFYGLSKFRLDNLFIAGEYTLLYGTEMPNDLKFTSDDLRPFIYCISNQGQILWKKEIDVFIDGHGIEAVAGDNEKVYVAGFKNSEKNSRRLMVLKINTKDGIVVEERKLDEIYENNEYSAEKTNRTELFISEFKMIGSELIIGFGKITKNIPKHPKEIGLKNAKICLIDENFNFNIKLNQEILIGLHWSGFVVGSRRVRFVDSRKSIDYAY